jgi:translation elongation factor EF-4
MELCNEHRGIQLDYRYDEASGRSTLRYELPLSEIATEFFSKLKSRLVSSARDDVNCDSPQTAILAGAKVMLHLITRMLVTHRVI